MAKFDNLSLENRNRVRKVLDIILNAFKFQGNGLKPSWFWTILYQSR
ncbi:MAG: hypothetical protein L7H18_00360 [Candidatus Nealsonbacteria bacterium DGGOD1a]|nr:MAG: hypothetical protein L7H18_00360 [Candidatus Nealsonbacteria bacterium DGGOD1a]